MKNIIIILLLLTMVSCNKQPEKDLAWERYRAIIDSLERSYVDSNEANTLVPIQNDSIK